MGRKQQTSSSSFPLFRIIILLALLGFGAAAFSGGDLNNLTWQNLPQRAADFFNNTDFGPLNGVISNMKEAFAYIRDDVLPKILEVVNKGK